MSTNDTRMRSLFVGNLPEGSPTDLEAALIHLLEETENDRDQTEAVERLVQRALRLLEQCEDESWAGVIRRRLDAAAEREVQAAAKAAERAKLSFAERQAR